MSEAQPEDAFSKSLTEIERLLVIWHDLAAAGVTDSPIAALIHELITDLSSSRMHAESYISFQNFSRLLEIWSSMKSRGTVGTSNIGCLVTFILDKFAQLKDAHSVSRFDERPKSTLQRFEDLEHWAALKTKVENNLPFQAMDRRIATIISLHVNGLPAQSKASPDSLRVIEMGANLLKPLPHRHHAKILQVIDSEIKAFAASNGKYEARQARTSASEANVGDDRAVQAISQASERVGAAKDAYVEVRSTIRHTRFTVVTDTDLSR